MLEKTSPALTPELRVRKTDDELDDKRRKTGYKVVALSGAYGTAAETNPIDVDPDDEKRKLRPVTIRRDINLTGLGDPPFDPEEILRTRARRDFQEEAIGFLTSPVEI
jgi:hypothetical protein